MAPRSHWRRRQPRKWVMRFLPRSRRVDSATHVARTTRFTITATTRRCPRDRGCPRPRVGGSGAAWVPVHELLRAHCLQDGELRCPCRGPEPGKHARDAAHDEQDGELGPGGRKRGRDEAPRPLRRGSDERPAEEPPPAETADGAEDRDDHRLPPDHRTKLAPALADGTQQPELAGPLVDGE